MTNKKNNIMVPKPSSKFISVQCTQCGEKRIIFSHSTTDISCKSCGEAMAKKTGSKASVLAKVIEVLD
jgi:small subunit ribosomal protein S27e